ncbi:MAG: transglutaminase-like domain-containing protein, partial [Akkermansiaceae bacterium]|nr:transglutaminase-like domain-containing protein [Akkermansiaceae bacterium]
MIPHVLSLAFGAVAAFLLLSGGSRELPSLARTCLALLLLLPVLGYWVWPRQTGAPAAYSRQPAGWLDWLSLGAVVAVIGSGFVWLLHAIPQPLESLSLNLEARLRPQAASARREARERQSKPQQGNWLWNDQSRRPLPKRTHFKPSNRPEIFLRLRDPGDAVELLQGQLYVRAFTLTRYQNASWSAHPGTPEILRADATGLVQLATPTRRPIVHEIFQSYDPAGQNVLTALQGVAAAQVPEVTRLDEGLFMLPPALKPSGYEYVASSAPLRLEDLPETPDIPVRPNLPPVFTQGTESSALAARIRDLAYIAAGTGTTQQRLRNLRNHLRTTLKYSLDCDNPADLDPIENFLFAEQRGHCEYFATAGALLARSLGIPARVAYGWAGGTYYENSNMFVFRAREAHAWTEVCLDGHGWVVLDPTPP